MRLTILPLIVSLIAVDTSAAEPAEFPQKQTVTYRQVGDLPIKADVYYFNNNKPRPAIVSLHGGALIMGNRKGISRPVREFALTNGYVLVSFDYRLAPETKVPAIIDDIETAFKWLATEAASQFNIDPNRIAVTGDSAGGYLTLVTGYRVKPRPRVLLSYFGYGDLISDWYSTRAHIRGTIRARSPPMKHGNKSKVRPSQTPANVKATAASSIIFAVKMAFGQNPSQTGTRVHRAQNSFPTCPLKM